MIRKCLLIWFLLMMGMSLCAQTHLFDNSMSMVSSLRDPARQSSHEIDAIIYNPAGLSFLNDGLTLSLGLSASFGVVPIHFSSSPNNVYKDGDYSQITIKSVPDFQLAYKQSQWTISYSYASEGGRGRWIAPQGFGMVDYVVGYTDHSLVDSIARITNALSSYDSIAVKAGKSSAIYYNHSFRLGFSYKFNEYISGYVGLKTMYLCSRVYARANYVVMNKNTNTYSTLSQFFELKNLQDSLVQIMQKISIVPETEESSNYNLAITPIVSIDINHRLGNVGLSLEIPTKGILISGGKTLCPPWIASLGTSWILPQNWTINLGGVVEGMYKDFANSIYTSMSDKRNPLVFYTALSTSHMFNDLPSSNGKLQLSVGLHIGNIDTRLSTVSFAEIPGIYWGGNCGFSYTFSSSSKIDFGLSYRFIDSSLTSHIESSSNILDGTLTGLERQSSQHFFAIGLSYTHNFEIICKK